MLTRAMKGTSHGKYNTLLRLVIKKVFLLCLGLFDASLFTGLIFVDFYCQIFRSRSKP